MGKWGRGNFRHRKQCKQRHKSKKQQLCASEAAGKVECEAEMAEQGSDHGGPCLSTEENEHGPIDLWFSNPSSQFPPYPPPS